MKRILVIDDNEVFRWSLSKTLKAAGFEVEVAPEGSAAIKLFKQQPFDLIITDLIMPGKEGLETIMDLKKLNSHIKIIAMSGGGRSDAGEYLPLAKGLGASHTLTKPFTEDELLGAISNLLKPPA